MKTIIILGDGKTWDTTGYILTLTDEGFEKLSSGGFKPHELDAKDHLMEVYLKPEVPK